MQEVPVQYNRRVRDSRLSRLLLIEAQSEKAA
jgi:hypothetical protein